MLTELRISNFKTWQDTGKIRLAPLTVLFGPNSSGKSSISQFLLMLKQTAESPDRLRVLHGGDRRTAIDLGTFYDMVYGHDERRRISFTLNWTTADNLVLPQGRSVELEPPDDKEIEISFSAEIGLTKTRREEVYVNRMSYLANKCEVGMEPLSQNDKQYKLVGSRGAFRRRNRFLPPPIHYYGFPDEAFGPGNEFVLDLPSSLEKQLHNLYYLGPLRSPPRSLYTWSGEVPEHVGWLGEYAIAAMMAARDRAISFGINKSNIRFDILVAERLKQMGLIETFRAVPIAPNRREYDVLVRTPSGPKEVKLTDVGFGISQVLPVIVQCFYAPRDSTILIEQPELHLHPATQASLADLFIDAVLAIENNVARRTQFIVESHSEHFLRRLQRRIAEQIILPDQTAIYFCQAGRSGAKLSPLDVDSFGNIKNWPDKFFGDEMGDLVAITRAAATRA